MVAALPQGCGGGECLGMTWDAADLDTREIDVSWQLVEVPYGDRAKKAHDLPPGYEYRHLIGTRFLSRPKTGAGRRVVPMVPWVWAALTAWREVAPANPWGCVVATTRVGVRPQNADADRRQFARCAIPPRCGSGPANAPGRYVGRGTSAVRGA